MHYRTDTFLHPLLSCPWSNRTRAGSQEEADDRAQIGVRKITDAIQRHASLLIWGVNIFNSCSDGRLSSGLYLRTRRLSYQDLIADTDPECIPELCVVVSRAFFSMCLYVFDVWRFFFSPSLSLFLSLSFSLGSFSLTMAVTNHWSGSGRKWKRARARLQLKCEEVITPKEELISLGPGSCCF